MGQGSLAFVLHAHLPYVRHPEHRDSFEERWLYEALTDTYIPLLLMLERLAADEVRCPLVLSISPTLLAMLDDPMLRQRYRQYVDRLLEFADKEVHRTRGDGALGPIARLYRDDLHRIAQRAASDIVDAFAALREHGLELMTSVGTHPYLPLFSACPGIVSGHVRTGLRAFETRLGHKPTGLWLPECGYYTGLDELLRPHGVKWFVMESHGVLYARPRPRYGTYAPLYTPGGVAAVARDMASSRQVWSSKEGYPGDYDYREFYRDAGYDLDLEYVRPYIHESGVRLNTGFKYYRITGPGETKEPYVPAWAAQKAAIHAASFVAQRARHVEHLAELYGRPPLIVAPYDAELFGHWWYEGVQWLELVLRRMHAESDTVELTTPTAFIAEHPRQQTLAPNPSSWGHKGYSEYWLNPSNDWIYPHLHHACRRLPEVARQVPRPRDLERRALNQMARELMLAMASDWAFIMRTGTHVQYASERTTQHLLSFRELEHALLRDRLEEGRVASMEASTPLFPDIDYRDFAAAQVKEATGG